MMRTFILSALLSSTMLLSAQTKEFAVMIYDSVGLEESYLLTDDISVSFEGDSIWLVVNDEKVCTLDLENENIVDIDFRTAFIMNGTNDPKNSDYYYSTFFSSEGAYKLPEESVTAYATTPEGEQLRMKAVGNVIAQGEPVVLKSSSESFVLMPTAHGTKPTEPNALEGTDDEETLGMGEYALSVGANGIGFYPWDGKTIADNNAYLPLGPLSSVSSFAFVFEGEEPTAIDAPHITFPESGIADNGIIYNLSGMRVGTDYKGIVIKNGKKFMQK